jgi:hypothetical protein
MDEAQFKLEARLCAIEYMVTNMYAFTHRVARSSPASIVKAHAECLRMLEATTHPDVDPAYSDAIASEIQDQVQRMLGAIEEMLGLARKPATDRS